MWRGGADEAKRSRQGQAVASQCAQSGPWQLTVAAVSGERLEGWASGEAARMDSVDAVNGLEPDSAVRIYPPSFWAGWDGGFRTSAVSSCSARMPRSAPLNEEESSVTAGE